MFNDYIRQPSISKTRMLRHGKKKGVGMYLRWCHKRDRTLFRPVWHGNVRLFQMWKHTWKKLWGTDCLVPNSGPLDLHLKVPGSKLNRETDRSDWRFTFYLCYSRNMPMHYFFFLRQWQIPFICFSIYYLLIIQPILYTCIIYTNIYKLIEA